MSHDTLGPSARARWSRCPASVRVSLALPQERRSTAASIAGTNAHTLLEKCIEAGLEDPSFFINQTFTNHEGDFRVDQEMTELVAPAVEYIRSKRTPSMQIFSERKVDPQMLTGRADMKGTVDVTLLDDGWCEIIDFKGGMHPVEVFQNKQLEQYAVGALAGMMAKGESVDTVTLTIIQPKLAFQGQAPIASWDVKADYLLNEVVPNLIAEAAACDDPDAPFNPGEEQCQWCPGRGGCTASQAYVLGKAGISFEAMDVAKDSAEKDPAQMTDEQIKEIVEAGPMLRKMIEAVEEEALFRITEGNPVPGLKVVRGTGRRQWALPEEEIAGKLTRMGMPKGEVWRTALVSPAQVEKVRWTKRDGTVKQLTDRQKKTVYGELVTKSEGKLTVVPEADKRDAVQFANVPAMFQPVDDLPDWMKI